MNDEIIYENFWKSLDILLEANGLSFKDFCDKMNLNYRSLRVIKARKQVPTSFPLIIQIANYFNVPVDYLLTGTKNQLPDDILKVSLQLTKLTPEQRKPILALLDGQINFWIKTFEK